MLIRRLLIGLAFLLLIGVFAAGGYLLGEGAAPSDQEEQRARVEARLAAEREPAHAAFATAQSRGRAEGATIGRRRGRKLGRRRGARAGRREAEAAASSGDRPSSGPPRASNAPGVSADPDDYPIDTPGPEPQGTSCPPPFTYHMGICKITRPARPDECPPGWEPAGETGACAPEPGTDPDSYER
jgi:hypothetical protein